MRHIALFFALLMCSLTSKAEVTAEFCWSSPESLTPSYSAPTSSNRYGEYISGVTFTDNGVSLTIDDSDVKEQSQKARFLYGYLTETVEMRAYAQSNIIIDAPEGMVVHQVIFEGAKVGKDYFTPYDEDSTFSGGSWTASASNREAKFYVDATINCTKITVVCDQSAAVTDLHGDSSTSTMPEEWYTLSGIKLTKAPTTRGIYFKHIGYTTQKIFIR